MNDSKGLKVLENKIKKISNRVKKIERRLEKLEKGSRSRNPTKSRNKKKVDSSRDSEESVSTDHSYLKKTIDDAKRRYNKERRP